MIDLSVVIPCYNAGAFIAQTIASVWEQTQPVRQIIVVDDGSTDQSAAVVEACARQGGPAPVLLIRQGNAGESRARNVGIARAEGQFIGFLDADDCWMPDKIRQQALLLESLPQAVGTHCRVFNFTRDLDDQGCAETERTKDNPSLRELIEYHWIAPSSLVVRRDVLRQRGVVFDENIRHSEDMLFIADLRLAGELRLVDQPLLAKRVHGGQQSRNIWHTIYSAQSRCQWVRRRAGELGPELAQELDVWLGRLMVQTLEDRYWRRQFAGYADARRRVAALYPQQLAASKVANRRIWPGWVYRLRDGRRHGTSQAR